MPDEKAEIHPVFLAFPSFCLTENLSPSALADFIRASFCKIKAPSVLWTEGAGRARYHLKFGCTSRCIPHAVQSFPCNSSRYIGRTRPPLLQCFGQATPGGISVSVPPALHRPAALCWNPQCVLLPIHVFSYGGHPSTNPRICQAFNTAAFPPRFSASSA